MIRLDVLWQRRGFVMRWGFYAALAALMLFLVWPWRVEYEALLRIQPELSTTGETTSLEAEMDVVQSWSTINETAQAMQRAVKVTPLVSMPLLHLRYCLEWVGQFIAGEPTMRYADYVPALRIEHFVISDPKPYIGRPFTLMVQSATKYVLVDGNGHDVLTGNLQELTKAKLSPQENAPELALLIGDIQAPPGTRFELMPVSLDHLTRTLQKSLRVARKGFRERSGLMEITYAGADPVFTRQFLEALVNTYVAKAYDRSALGKMEGLEKLREKLARQRDELAQAQANFAAFKEKQAVMSMYQDVGALHAGYAAAQQELRKLVSQYKELSTSMTDRHPAVAALKKQMDYAQAEVDRLQADMQAMPEKQREAAGLENDIAIARTRLDQNTTLIAQLEAEVETITGYAKLISLHRDETLSPVKRGLLAAILGFFTGAFIALAWTIRHTSPAFARVRYSEDLAAVAPLPVIAKLPFKWSGIRWLWYRRYDRSTVASERAWKALALREVERLAQEMPLLLPPAAQKILMFTSIDGHSGVAFCARQLAVASARERKTLLIDANIMRPGAHREFDSAETPGLVEALTGQVPLAQAIQHTRTPDLFILPAGTETPNFRLLDDVKRMRALLSECASLFERVVIEFAPLLDGQRHGEALRLMDAVFMVVNRDTPVRELSRALLECDIAAHPAAFFILNKR